MVDLIGIQIDRDMNVRLQKLARHLCCTVDDLIVEAVKEYYADEFHRAEQTEPSDCEKCCLTKGSTECKHNDNLGFCKNRQTEPSTDGYACLKKVGAKANQTEPSTEEKVECPFDDKMPCEWVCPNSTDCSWK